MVPLTMELGRYLVAMRYDSEVDVMKDLGIDSWRNLSKDTFFRFLDMVPEVDKEVALKLVAQIPEFANFAKVALDDAERAYEGALSSNTRSQKMVHEVHLQRLSMLKGELDKDLSPEERLRVLDDIREVNQNAIQLDRENKKFLSEQFDKRLGVAVTAALTVAAAVVAVIKSGGKGGGGVGRVLKS